MLVSIVTVCQQTKKLQNYWLYSLYLAQKTAVTHYLQKQTAHPFTLCPCSLLHEHPLLGTLSFQLTIPQGLTQSLAQNQHRMNMYRINVFFQSYQSWPAFHLLCFPSFPSLPCHTITLHKHMLFFKSITDCWRQKELRGNLSVQSQQLAGRKCLALVIMVCPIPLIFLVWFCWEIKSRAPILN